MHSKYRHETNRPKRNQELRRSEKLRFGWELRKKYDIADTIIHLILNRDAQRSPG